MRRITCLATIFAVAAVVAGAAAAAHVLKFGPGDNGKSYLVHRGDVLVISLPGNATTGYAWRLASVKRSVLKPTGVKYVPRKTGTAGAGGTYKLSFRAVSLGQATVKLVYRQGGSGLVAKRFSLTALVSRL
jgi:predicted secreted protein